MDYIVPVNLEYAETFSFLSRKIVWFPNPPLKTALQDSVYINSVYKRQGPTTQTAQVFIHMLENEVPVDAVFIHSN